jgi:hypothetical protein
MTDASFAKVTTGRESLRVSNEVPLEITPDR